MPVNDNFVQLKGKALINVPLQYDKDYFVRGRFSVSGKKELPTGEGTTDVTYLLEPSGEFEIENEAGKKVEVRRRGKLSQALRWKIILFMRDEWKEGDLDDDALYDLFMNRLINSFENLAPLILREIEKL